MRWTCSRALLFAVTFRPFGPSGGCAVQAVVAPASGGPFFGDNGSYKNHEAPQFRYGHSSDRLSRPDRCIRRQRDPRCPQWQRRQSRNCRQATEDDLGRGATCSAGRHRYRSCGGLPRKGQPTARRNFRFPQDHLSGGEGRESGRDRLRKGQGLAEGVWRYVEAHAAQRVLRRLQSLRRPHPRRLVRRQWPAASHRLRLPERRLADGGCDPCRGSQARGQGAPLVRPSGRRSGRRPRIPGERGLDQGRFRALDPRRRDCGEERHPGGGLLRRRQVHRIHPEGGLGSIRRRGLRFGGHTSRTAGSGSSGRGGIC